MLGVVSQKHRSEQLETAIRMRYPQVHRRPEMAFLVAGLELLFLVCPFLIALLGWHMPITRLSQLCAAFTAILLTFGYVRLARAMHLSALPYALFGFPIMVLADIVILHRSMWQYEFSEVTWKGRNVCIPVMHTYASLPKITTGYSPPLKGSE